MIAFGVLLISAVSVFVAYNANRTQGRILVASVWPSLVFGTSTASPEGLPQVSLDLLNRGVGPTRVRWAEVSYKGQPVSDLLRCWRHAVVRWRTIPDYWS